MSWKIFFPWNFSEGGERAIEWSIQAESGSMLIALSHRQNDDRQTDRQTNRQSLMWMVSGPGKVLSAPDEDGPDRSMCTGAERGAMIILLGGCREGVPYEALTEDGRW